MGARLYNPSLGRFLQTDPVFQGSATAYDYVNQNPTTGLDLDGTRSGSYCRHGTMWKYCRLYLSEYDTQQLEAALNWGASVTTGLAIAVGAAGAEPAAIVIGLISASCG
jgi:hypothetical protein